MTPLISLTDLTVRRDAFHLGPFSLEIEPGYIVAVVGPNGSGKSTLFHALMNLVRPQSGIVRMFGKDYPEADVEIRRRIGYVPERLVGMDRLSARELGEFSAHWYPGWDGRWYRRLLEAMEIDPGQPVGKLSKGSQRRVSSALALSTGGDLLLADEPMDAIDPFFSEYLIECYTEFMSMGDRSIVFSTHSLDEVRRAADYILLMSKGEMVGYFEKDTLLESWQVFWIDGPLIPGTPGVVSMSDGRLRRVLTQDADATRVSAHAQGRTIVRTAAPELGEILGALLDRAPAGRDAVMR
jgi:ABC-2 type transport system ATP-binding protein